MPAASGSVNWNSQLVLVTVVIVCHVIRSLEAWICHPRLGSALMLSSHAPSARTTPHRVGGSQTVRIWLAATF